MRKFDIAIVGAGASGITAAISAKRLGKSVILCEKTERIGKKILASGNGRCNFLNEKLDESFYNQASQPLVRSIFKKFGELDIKKFFDDLGLESYSEESRIFPATNQSASVLKVLEMELERLKVPLELKFDVISISPVAHGFSLMSKVKGEIGAENVIITGGGKTYPSFGSDGSAYKIAASLGHAVIEPVPVAVPLVSKDQFFHAVQGQRISANAKALIDGKVASVASGDVLFTKYGLSGTAILDISEEVSIAINRQNKKDVVVSLDLTPFMEEKRLEEEFVKRLGKGFEPEELIVGILPNKFGVAFKNVLDTKDPRAIAAAIKDKRFNVTGTRGWNEADFTAGGVRVVEVKEGTLESKLKKRIYFAGEILDVNGKRGGYNLAWAWASGFVAGLTG